MTTLEIAAPDAEHLVFLQVWPSFFTDGLARNTTLTALELHTGTSQTCDCYTRERCGEAILAALQHNRVLVRLVVDVCAFGLVWLNGIACLSGETSALREIHCVGTWVEAPSYSELLRERDSCLELPITALLKGSLPLTYFSFQRLGIEQIIDSSFLAALTASRSLIEFKIVQDDVRVDIFEETHALFEDACRLVRDNRSLRAMILCNLSNIRSALDFSLQPEPLKSALEANHTLVEFNGASVLANVARHQRRTRNWVEVGLLIASYRAARECPALAHALVPLHELVAFLADSPMPLESDRTNLSVFAHSLFFRASVDS